jgi:hypothetical protein
VPARAAVATGVRVAPPGIPGRRHAVRGCNSMRITGPVKAAPFDNAARRAQDWAD